VAARILERRQSGPSLEDLETTSSIDEELLNAANCQPASFWLPPKFAEIRSYSETEFAEMHHLVSQFYHYNLLNQLHLPYLCRFDNDGKYEYSKQTCVTASREILTRYTAFRSYNGNMVCTRMLDFIALKAAMTLLLAHLQSHHFSKNGNYLAHQRLADRAMAEQVLLYTELNTMSSEEGSDESANLLPRLLSIEADAAQGHSYVVQNVQTAGGPQEDDLALLHISIPYFGVIRITREGLISMNTPTIHTSQMQRVGGYDNLASTRSLHVANNRPPVNLGRAARSASPNLYQITFDDLTPNFEQRQIGDELPGASGNSQPVLTGHINDRIPQQYIQPDLAAGVDDWAFQGVDTAFFESLLRGANTEF